MNQGIHEQMNKGLNSFSSKFSSN